MRVGRKQKSSTQSCYQGTQKKHPGDWRSRWNYHCPPKSLLQLTGDTDWETNRPDGCPMVHITHEGFGRALIMVGNSLWSTNIARHPSFRLLKPWRSVRESEKIIEKALGLIEKYNAAAMTEKWNHVWRNKKTGKEVKKTKRLASEQAMELHDLIEDRLPWCLRWAYGDCAATYDACKAWDEANQKLNAAQAEAAWPGD